MATLPDRLTAYLSYFADSVWKDAKSPFANVLGDNSIPRYTHQLIVSAEKRDEIFSPYPTGIAHLGAPDWPDTTQEGDGQFLTPLLELSSDPSLAVAFLSLYDASPNSYHSLPLPQLYWKHPTSLEFIEHAHINQQLQLAVTPLLTSQQKNVYFVPHLPVRDRRGLTLNDFAREWSDSHPPLTPRAWPSTKAFMDAMLTESTPGQLYEYVRLQTALQQAGIPTNLTRADIPFEPLLVCGTYQAATRDQMVLLVNDLCAQQSHPDASMSWRISIESQPNLVEGRSVVLPDARTWQTPDSPTLGSLAHILLQAVHSEVEAAIRDWRYAVNSFDLMAIPELVPALILPEYFALAQHALDQRNIISILDQPWVQIYVSA